jgi:hypothetical protein
VSRRSCVVDRALWIAHRKSRCWGHSRFGIVGAAPSPIGRDDAGPTVMPLRSASSFQPLRQDERLRTCLVDGCDAETQWAKPPRSAQTSPVVELPGECRSFVERDPRSRSALSGARKCPWGSRRQSAKQVLIPSQSTPLAPRSLRWRGRKASVPAVDTVAYLPTLSVPRSGAGVNLCRGSYTED